MKVSNNDYNDNIYYKDEDLSYINILTIFIHHCFNQGSSTWTKKKQRNINALKYDQTQKGNYIN
ncbi:hypothetical protein PIROE2DRAFT_14860 [Piromyces sp. E2]|nr:hypothetical protein PIROE2DRAFT_14860 [Piromyces sp. E2]|eukprot:OUM59558.1 hypothetical protein PIROE2DRAFT_14860 [Piromyces sp. E2]